MGLSRSALQHVAEFMLLEVQADESSAWATDSMLTTGHNISFKVRNGRTFKFWLQCGYMPHRHILAECALSA